MRCPIMVGTSNYSKHDYHLDILFIWTTAEGICLYICNQPFPIVSCLYPPQDVRYLDVFVIPIDVGMLLYYDVTDVYGKM